MEVVQYQENEIATKNENGASPEPPLKHHLEHKWTLWFFENNKNKSWMQNLHEVYTFDTVEDFWCLYNHIRSVNELAAGNDYMLFKCGIHPSWEDKANKEGGRWVVNVDPKQKHNLSDMWLNVILFMIGESFDEYSDEICGAYINIRKIDKISLWTASAISNEDKIMAVGKKLKYDCLHLNADHRITYETHEDSQKKSGSKANYTLCC